MPGPLSRTEFGLAGSEVLMPKPAALVFLVVGVKVMEIVHPAPGANEAPQVLASAKSPGFKPPIKILLMGRLFVPLLVKVSFLGLLVAPTSSVRNLACAGETLTDVC